MVQVGEIAWNVQGDIGGVGVSRFRFIRQDAGSIMGADVNAAASASHSLLASALGSFPTDISWACNLECKIYDDASGAVVPPLNVTSPPANVVGTASGAYGAGVGGRINWHTSLLVGRRLLRGATFLVPFASPGFTSNGAISSGITTAVNGGIGTYLNAMTTALLYPVVWHRPRKGQTSGGTHGIIVSGQISPVPAGLRSRRS